MTSVSTHSIAITKVHTAVHLTEVILGTISDILAELRIVTSGFARDWENNERAIKAWITEGSLAPVIEFPVAYTGAGVGNADFTASRARLARFRAKLDRVPAGTVYRLFCTFNGPRTSQPGWSPGTRASTDGLRGITFGTLGRAPDGSVSMRYLHG
jgi:hypothetical protein